MISSHEAVVGTWCFDVRSEPDGEYDGLSRELEKDNNWADYIMDDSHGDYPRYFLDHGVAGGLPLRGGAPGRSRRRFLFSAPAAAMSNQLDYFLHVHIK
jgi:hypothetical protein